MNFLTLFLAGFLDKFKVANPSLFVLIQFVLGLLIYAMTNCGDVLGFCATEAFGHWSGEIVGVLIGLGLITQSRTTGFIKRG